MVRELVSVQVGQCGNQVGGNIWQELFREHALDKSGCFKKDLIVGNQAFDEDGDGILDQLEKIDVYFRSVGHKEQQKFTPRAVMVDLEPGTIEVIKSSAFATAFNADNLIAGSNGAGNNWAKGHYTEGAELVDEVMDVVRKEIEKCEAPQGVQICHSLGGGTGSGLGTLLLLKIRDSYPDRITKTYSVFPSPKVSDVVVEPYNAVLSSHQLLENSDETFVVDNEALYNISHNVLKIKEPTYASLNKLVAYAVCGITASLRFPGKLNGDLRKLGVNLVPFPRLHFFLTSYAPLLALNQQKNTSITVQFLTTTAFSQKNFFSNITPADGKYLACSLVYRGAMATEEVDEEIKKVQEKQSNDFVDWIPNNFKTSIIKVNGGDGYFDDKKEKWVPSYDKSATFCANTTATKSIFQRLATQFGKLYKRKAFLHWYKGEGMDEMEFQEADKNVRDLITEYQDKQDAVYEAEEDEDNDDEEDI